MRFYTAVLHKDVFKLCMYFTLDYLSIVSVFRVFVCWLYKFAVGFWLFFFFFPPLMNKLIYISMFHAGNFVNEVQ